MISSASRSGTSTSCRVAGGPGIRSPLTIVVRPRLAHSARIMLIGAFSVTSFTWPFLNSRFTADCAEAGPATTHSSPTAAKIRVTFMAVPSVYDLIPARLLLPDVLDHCLNDLIQLEFRSIANQ